MLSDHSAVYSATAFGDAALHSLAAQLDTVNELSDSSELHTCQSSHSTERAGRIRRALRTDTVSIRTAYACHLHLGCPSCADRLQPLTPAACLQWLARGSRRDRVAAKFVENEFEKVDRLMELYGRYTTRVAAEERRLGTSDESYDDEEILLARMDAGLYTLQQVCMLYTGLVGLAPGSAQRTYDK